MNVLITGGAGYIGQSLTKYLERIEDINSITIYDNLSNGKRVMTQSTVSVEKVRFVEADILDNSSLKRELSDIDVVIHLATVSYGNHHYMEQVNHWGTANIINTIDELTIKKFIFISTDLVYGVGDRPFTTRDLPSPQTPYAISMHRAEKYVLTLANKCPFSIVRSAELYGYGNSMNMESHINRLMFDAKYKRIVQLKADGLQRISAIHVDNLSKFITKLISTKLNDMIYNASKEQFMDMEIYERLKNIYTDLEATFTSHHLRLKDRLIANSEYNDIKKIDFDQSIHDFINNTNY